jgi:hypothetical protein
VSRTDEDFPFAIRRGELLDRAVAILSTDARFPAGWLEGSLADGSADSFSDIDLHLCVGAELNGVIAGFVGLDNLSGYGSGPRISSCG